MYINALVKRYHSVELNHIISGILARTMAGLLLGFGARLAMRLVAIFGGIPVDFSISGTVFIVILGSFFGAVLGLIYLVIRRFLPGPPAIKGLLYGLLITTFIVLPPFLRQPEGELALVSPTTGFALFGSLPLIYGLALGLLVDKLDTRFAVKTHHRVRITWIGLYVLEDHMHAETTRTDSIFWLQWLVATAIGMLASGMLAVPLGFGLGEIVQNNFGETIGFIVAGIVFGLLFGAGLGISQWLVLRQRLTGMNGWAPATAIAAAIGLAVAFTSFTSWTESDLMVGIIFGTFLSLPISLAQWLILRKHIIGAGWWLIFNIGGLILGLMMLSILGDEGQEIIGLTAGGIITGVITGAGMTWMLRPSAV